MLQVDAKDSAELKAPHTYEQVYQRSELKPCADSYRACTTLLNRRRRNRVRCQQCVSIGHLKRQ